jgi:hypothetical protein
MVALQEDALVHLTVLDQSVDRFTRRRTTIDIVAQENVNRPYRRSKHDISADPGQQFIEQIEATMNVADGINPKTCRQTWATPTHSEFL